jgi:tRNA(Ile)-lysidine synthase
MDRPGAARPRQLSEARSVESDGVRAGAVDLVDDLLSRCRFPPPGRSVVCAVSGGPDSTALAALAVAAGCAVSVVHVDHGLRPDSGTDAAIVTSLADRLGVPCRSVAVVVEPGGNLEARARAARHAALPPDALFGHTADDQAETVLLNLVRGTGLDGLAGIAPDERHPLLALRRHETRGLCRALGLETVEDVTNESPAHRRNRIRHEALPLLGDIAERDVVPLLCRLAVHARQTVDHLEREAAAIDPTDARALAAAPPVLAQVAVRRWLREASPERHPPDAACVERVMAVAAGDHRATEISGGWRVTRHAGRLLLECPSE